jgi:hypothetical protein
MWAQAPLGKPRSWTEDGFLVIVDLPFIHLVDPYLDDVASIVGSYGDVPRLLIDVEYLDSLADVMTETAANARRVQADAAQPPQTDDLAAVYDKRRREEIAAMSDSGRHAQADLAQRIRDHMWAQQPTGGPRWWTEDGFLVIGQLGMQVVDPFLDDVASIVADYGDVARLIIGIDECERLADLMKEVAAYAPEPSPNSRPLL